MVSTGTWSIFREHFHSWLDCRIHSMAQTAPMPGVINLPNAGTLYTVPHAVETPNHKLFCCYFITLVFLIMAHNVNIWHAGYLIYDPYEREVGGRNPQVENHSSALSAKLCWFHSGHHSSAATVCDNTDHSKFTFIIRTPTSTWLKEVYFRLFFSFIIFLPYLDPS